LNIRGKRVKINYLYIFLAPATLLIAMFFLAPVILTVLISFTSMDVVGLKWEWNWGENYIRMLNDRWSRKILLNTLFYVFTTLACFNVGMALVLSILTTHVHEKIGSVFRALWLLPRITPSTVYAVMWLWATAPYPFGLWNWLLVNLGIVKGKGISFLGYSFVELFGAKIVPWPWVIIVLVNGFVGASFGMIIFTSAIKSIPVDFINAAKVDGASTWQTIRHVILPLIKWPILFVTAYQTLSLLTSYEYILLVTNGGPGFYTTEVWALYSYHRAFEQYAGYMEFGYGAALSSVLVTIGLIAAVVYWKVFKFRELMIEPKIEVL